MRTTSHWCRKGEGGAFAGELDSLAASIEVQGSARGGSRNLFWGGQTKVPNRKLRAKPESRARSARVSRAKPESRARSA